MNPLLDKNPVPSKVMWGDISSPEEEEEDGTQMELEPPPSIRVASQPAPIPVVPPPRADVDKNWRQRDADAPPMTSRQRKRHNQRARHRAEQVHRDSAVTEKPGREELLDRLRSRVNQSHSRRTGKTMQDARAAAAAMNINMDRKQDPFAALAKMGITDRAVATKLIEQAQGGKFDDVLAKMAHKPKV